MCDACRTHPCSVEHPVTWTSVTLEPEPAGPCEATFPRPFAFALNDRIALPSGRVFRIAGVESRGDGRLLSLEPLEG